jgi:tetratricopeptide (TPR) repeat protein
VALAFSLGAAATAFAEDDAMAAKAHFETGVRHFDLSEYEPALAAFKEAYRSKPDPVFLYNIAQCHRKLGHTDEAITFYQNYLRRAPEAKNRAEVERRLAELQSLRPAESVPAAEPTSGRAQPAPLSTGSEPRPSPTSDKAQEKAAVPNAETLPAPAVISLSPQEEPPQTNHSPIYKRWWFWTAIGAVLAGTAVTVGILVTRDPTKIPPSSLGSQKVLP